MMRVNAVGSLRFLKAFDSNEHCHYSTVMMVRIKCSQHMLQVNSCIPLSSCT